MSDRTPSHEPLPIKHYQRHRPPSVWGAVSLAMLALTALWYIFWYLMMNQRRLDELEPPRGDWQKDVLIIGAMALAGLGAVVAMLGMFDTAHRRTRAAVALVLHLLVLIIIGLVVSLRVVSQM